MRLKYSAVSILLLLIVPAVSVTLAGTTGKKRWIRPDEYGNVLIDNYSTLSNTVSPVVFKHWVHRSKYTCRLCHIDIGFAMMAGRTDITCDDIVNGIYCGACHDGGESFARIGKGPDGQEVFNCELCHSQGEEVTFKYNFRKFRKPMPRERFGNGINWQKAEEKNIITLKDYLKGVSIRKGKKFKDPEELRVSAGDATMPDIIFSHKKHAVWSGCELCHPDPFGIKAGDTVYSMTDIFEGKFCGMCHGFVAFPNNDCQRCHTKEVY